MNKINKSIQRCSCFLLCLILFFALKPIPATAEKTETKAAKTEQVKSKVVKVGWYEDSYHITDKNGGRSGYGYEFEQAVSAYTGWKYEYVTGDWTELVEKLQKGEIDMMGALSYTDERAKSMLFSDQPMGEEKYYLYADLANSDISASDLSTLNGKSVAMMEQSVQTTQFYEWEKKYHITTKHVFVDSIDQAKELLAKHEIQGVISTETSIWVDAGLSAIVTTGGSGIYCCINKNRPDLKKELDNAMRSMEHDKPFYSDELYQRYIATQSVAVLSGEEKDWLKKHDAIRVGYLNDDPGFSAVDSKSGELVGVINDYIDYAQKCFEQKLKFETVGFDSQEEQIKALNDGKIDMIFHVNQNPYYAEKNGLSLSNTVLSTSVAAVTAQDAFDENAENTVAITKENSKYKWYVSYNYPNWKFVEYNSFKDMEKAVSNGKADCLLVSSSKAMNYVNDKKLHSVFLTKAGNTSFAVSRENTVLLSILNKTLKSIQTSKLTGAVSMYEDSMKKVTLADFIKDNFLIVTIVSVVVFLLILSVILALLKKAQREASRSQKLNTKLQESQHDLKMALLQAESANSAKTSFLNNMSHDIRTPMNAIIGFTTLATTHIDNKELVQDYLRKIGTSSEHLLSLINDVLDMSRIESGKVKIDEKPVHLPDLLHDICTIIRPSISSEQLDFLVDMVDVVDEDIIADKLRLTQLLLNILSNAVKYNKTGGTVSLRVKQEKKAPAGCATYHFIIKDTGIGIRKEFQEHIFENFSREETATVSGIQGTGLGLAITKKIVEMMGGTISLESEEGVGSEFDVCLTFKLNSERKVDPNVLSRPIPVTEPEPEQDISVHKGKKILLVEDNELNQEIAAEILKEAGFDVEVAEDGAVAVQKMADSKPGQYDLILMDIQMPVMNGYESTRQIRAMKTEHCKQIPILAMTANAFEDDRTKATQVGMNGYLTKPIQIDEMLKVINSVL